MGFLKSLAVVYLVKNQNTVLFNGDDKLTFHKFHSSMHDLGKIIGKAIHISNDCHFLL